MRDEKPVPNLIFDFAGSFAKNKVLDFGRREVLELEIYDRWGKKVFSASPYVNNCSTNDLDAGTYFLKAQTKSPGQSTFSLYTDWLQVLK